MSGTDASLLMSTCKEPEIDVDFASARYEPFDPRKIPMSRGILYVALGIPGENGKEAERDCHVRRHI